MDKVRLQNGEVAFMALLCSIPVFLITSCMSDAYVEDKDREIKRDYAFWYSHIMMPEFIIEHESDIKKINCPHVMVWDQEFGRWGDDRLRHKLVHLTDKNYVAIGVYNKRECKVPGCNYVEMHKIYSDAKRTKD